MDHFDSDVKLASFIERTHARKLHVDETSIKYYTDPGVKPSVRANIAPLPVQPSTPANSPFIRDAKPKPEDVLGHINLKDQPLHARLSFVLDNPKKLTSKSHARYEQYKHAESLGDFFAKTSRQHLSGQS